MSKATAPRERGVFLSTCDFCRAHTLCKLTQYENRWMWRCVDPTGPHPPWKLVG